MLNYSYSFSTVCGISNVALFGLCNFGIGHDSWVMPIRTTGTMLRQMWDSVIENKP